VTAVALDMLGSKSKIDNSPNMSGGPMRVSSFTRPSGERRAIFTLPEAMTYTRSHNSPAA
jgi:hypothetical protein